MTPRKGRIAQCNFVGEISGSSSRRSDIQSGRNERRGEFVKCQTVEVQDDHQLIVISFEGSDALQSRKYADELDDYICGYLDQYRPKPTNGPKILWPRVNRARAVGEQSTGAIIEILFPVAKGVAVVTMAIIGWLRDKQLKDRLGKFEQELQELKHESQNDKQHFESHLKELEKKKHDFVKLLNRLTVRENALKEKLSVSESANQRLQKENELLSNFFEELKKDLAWATLKHGGKIVVEGPISKTKSFLGK